MQLMEVKDVYFSWFMLALVLTLVPAYVIRSLLRGRARHERTEADGGSVLLNKASMELGYWMLNPLIEALAALRITPNMVTAFSLVPAFAAGVAVAFGWFALACVLATVGSLCDLVDGVLARKLGVASDAGEVVDAAVDRYVESFFLGGLVIYYRSHWIVMLLALAAFFGSFMVSYTTAKAEAMGVPPPRGLMRRAERAIYLLVAAGLTGFSKVIFADSPSHALRELPIILAITVVAVLTNLSSVQRFAAITQALRAREPATPPAPVGDGDGIITKRDTPAGLV
jgi:CDP-diacylglycerol---glycerol-3-phosphate 3-phosphatidyltransferase